MMKLALLQGEEEEARLPRRPDDSEAEAASWGEPSLVERESGDKDEGLHSNPPLYFRPRRRSRS